MSKREKNSWLAVFIGPVLVFLSLSGLWKNETRFDYYKAASRIEPAASLANLQSGQSLAYTGTMNPQAVELNGKYVDQFVGYLVVYRDAEIYAWDRDKDSDGDVTWSRRWMSHLESNSRNSGLNQQLSSETYLPEKYEISDLTVESQRIEFVDRADSLPANRLTLTPAGGGLSPEGNYLFLRKGNSSGIGDERVSYRAIPVPSTATYFGKYERGIGVADRSHERTNFVNLIIQDTGILHHLVAGGREQALATMKAYLSRLKWWVRGICTFLVVLGFVISFSKLVGFLFHLPVIGQLAELGVWGISLCLGIPLALATMVAGYLASHPMILVLFLCMLVASIYGLSKVFRRGRQTQRAMRGELESEIGHPIDANELKEMEFVGLSRMLDANGDSDSSGAGSKVLNDWSKKHRWSHEKQQAILAQAETAAPIDLHQELQQLIRIAIADGTLTPAEMRSIHVAAAKAGYDRQQVRALMRSTRRTAELRSNVIASNAG